jgi:cell division protein ZapA (FtsZ GTPase activity inhibitor)
MKHIELLNLICKYKKILDEGYKQRKLLSVPNELVEIGLFSKIGGFYYINEIYLSFVDTLLSRADLSYIAEDFEKEVKKLKEYKNEYNLKKTTYLAEIITSLITKIYQGMKNRDKRVLALIENFENDKSSDLDFLIKEAKRILVDIEEIMQKNETIYNVFEEFLSFREFESLVKDILIDITDLNQNIDSYLKRLREFISQTEKKRIFNQKLFSIANLILNEYKRIDDFLAIKRFAVKQKIEPLPDNNYVDYERALKVLGKFTRKKKVKKAKVKKDIQEVIELIDLKKLLEYIKGSDDIFKSIIEYLPRIDRELINESVRVFVYILNHYDKKLEYKRGYNEYNVRVVKWKK